ncbi:MAG: oligogalacturonate lyase [Hymenobacter sp.]
MLALSGVLGLSHIVRAQARLETGGPKPMPAEWVDQSTGHKVVRLTQPDGDNASFYFHNNPFLKGRAGEGDLMVIYHTDPKGHQLRLVNLKTRHTEPLTRYFSQVKGEIVGRKRREVFYQVQDTVYATSVDSKKTRRVFVFPADFKADITSLNADETLLGGAWGSDAEKEIYRQYPAKSDFFTRIYEAKLPRTLFVVGVQNGTLTKLFTDNAWLNHVQFSPTDPDLLMFCHEGPWHKVDRIWHINIKTKAVKLMHQRTVEGEIAGHEFFSPDGKTIWFDLQKPRSVTFFLAGADVKTGKEKLYQLERNEWSIHFNISPDQRLFAGDGGDAGQVAKAPDGRWINLFHPEGSRFRAERLVNMQHHGYKLEPNIHFTPDGKWLVFRANFEGQEQVYAVEIANSAT